MLISVVLYFIVCIFVFESEKMHHLSTLVLVNSDTNGSLGFISERGIHYKGVHCWPEEAYTESAIATSLLLKC